MTGQAENLMKIQHLLKKNSFLYSNVFSFSSGKGGTGKTFLSMNLAYLLSEKGNKVLIIDLDVSCANVHLLLNEFPRVTLENYVTGKALFSEVITTYKKNLDIVYGSSGLQPDVNLAFNIENGISQVHNKYDVIILDMGPGLTEFAAKIISNCENNIIIMTPEPTSVMDAYAMLKMLHIADYNGTNNIVVNKCTEAGESKTAFKNLQSACRNFLKAEITDLGELTYDSAVINSIKEQNLFIVQNPDHSLIKEMKKITSGFMQ